MTIVELSPSSMGSLAVHIGIFVATTAVSLALIVNFFFKADASEQDQYYLRGNVTKMVKLAGKPRHVGGKYWLYRATLADDQAVLGADMQKIDISFEYVSGQDIDYDPKRADRFPVENFGAKGYFEIIEKEDSDIDKILRRNADAKEPFEFAIKGPFGGLKYTGNGSFFE